MAAPLKNVTVEELEKALAAALLGLGGRTVSVSVDALRYDATTNRVDVEFRAWDKLAEDPFAGVI